MVEQKISETDINRERGDICAHGLYLARFKLLEVYLCFVEGNIQNCDPLGYSTDNRDCNKRGGVKERNLG